MKKIAYCIGWFVDKVIISALLLLIWLPYSIFILPIGIFNPFKRKHFYWINDPGVIGTDDFRYGLMCIWLMILLVFTFLFCYAPIFTLYLISSIIIFVLFVCCYHEYKFQKLKEKCKKG
ncbi:MAG: hypothetical protein IKP65_05525 [Alphaproteobacteria bacterium]|nr:hypothetical protein [Alphaproteobacteria bacterium]